MKNMIVKYCAALIVVLLCGTSIFAQDIERSVVKIFVTSQEYDFSQPWQKSKQSKSNGSGCIIDSNKILTCAHVVEYGEFIEVRKGKDSRKYTARVAFVAPEYDLAILEVDDEKFFSKSNILPIADIPRVGDRVTAYGFPTGGNDLSITSGIVSRIENIDYSYNNFNNLAIQIDAAINPGNSGGPVIKDSALAGIAFQGRSSGQSIGYMIPTNVIRTFLADIEDGVYDGPVPVLMKWQAMENTTLRECYAIDDTLTGVLVNEIHFCSLLRSYLLADDIILGIDGMEVQNDGSVITSGDFKSTFENIIQSKRMEDTLALRLLRSGLDTLIEIPVEYSRAPALLVEKVALRPKYYIEDGFVFTTPSYYYFQHESYWQYYNPLLSYYYYGRILNNEKKEEVVLISSVLPDKSNIGYHDLSNRIVRSVNGLPIRNFSDLIAAFKMDTDVHVIEDIDRNKYMISTSNLEQTNKEIMQKYGIPSQMRN